MHGSRKQGRPKPRFKGTLKSRLKWSGINSPDLEASAADRSALRSITLQAAAAFEEDSIQHLATAKHIRHKAAPHSIKKKGKKEQKYRQYRLCNRWTPMDYLHNDIGIHLVLVKLKNNKTADQSEDSP